MKVNYELKETVKTEKQEYELSHKMDYTIHFLQVQNEDQTAEPKYYVEFRMTNGDKMKFLHHYNEVY